jgi:endonuclease YncB( thermonuclease family)
MRPPAELTSMVRILHEMVRAVALLPLIVKVFVGLGILAIFVVVTQWERLTLKHLPVPASPKVSISSQQSEQRSFDFPNTPPADKAQAAAVESHLVKRIGRLFIAEPQVQFNGSIVGNGQTLYLYGIKQFNSKKLCTRASGERWACGLHAYATLRNAVARKTIVCDPKKLLLNGVSAICRMGTTDVALILIRDGLAELDDNIEDDEMVKAQAFAKSQKLGIWDH